MHFLGFVFFVKYSKEEASHYQAFGNQNKDESSFVKQCPEISFNLFLDIFLNSRSIRSTDKFAAIRELWHLVMDNCQKSYFPHANVTVDEQLLP